MRAFRCISIPLVITVLFFVLLMPYPAYAQKPFVQTGVASFYAEEFHGKKTANGEIYNMWAMTAAHQTLPFNTLVKVTNLENKKAVTVRINDAGPFKDKRIIDLTRMAAAKIGMIKNGTAKVKLEVVGKELSKDGTDPIENSDYYSIAMKQESLKGFAIQLASFTDMENLMRQIDALNTKGITNTYVQMATVKGHRVHRIITGVFPDRDKAEKELLRLKKKSVTGFVFAIR